MVISTPDWPVAAALLAIAASFDVTKHRIPNAIPVALAATGLLSSLARSGPGAALSGSGALLVVFAALVVAWRLRAVGGGDLKLAAAAATWVGFAGLWRYAAASALALGVVAAVSYAISSRAVRREIRLNLALAGRGVHMPVEISGGAGRVPVPAGAAFAVGALYALLFGG